MIQIALQDMMKELIKRQLIYGLSDDEKIQLIILRECLQERLQTLRHWED